MAKVYAVIAIFACVLSSRAFAEEPHKLDRIVVTPSRIYQEASESGRSITTLDRPELAASSYHATADEIGNLSSIDIRRRGPEGVQSDVNIRGATFEQNSVLIDGIPINDPQTGHHTMDLPVTTGDVNRVEVLKGPASSLYGANSFGGVINIITAKPDEKKITAYASGGSFDYVSGGVSASYAVGPFSNRFSFEDSRSSGYMPQTQFNILSLSEKAVLETGAGTYDLFFGYTKKDFGADSFYSNIYSNEAEHTDTRFFKIGATYESKDVTVTPALFLRRHGDKFQLDTNRPGWQTNYHTNYTYGMNIPCVVENSFLDVAYGFELARDTIDSTNLEKHDRGRGGAYVEFLPHLTEKITARAGVREDYFELFGWECSPSASIAYRAYEHITLRSSIGRSYRIPTFTDLYYSDAANIGNPALRPESSWSYDWGLDYTLDAIDISGTFFMRNAYDTIDWTRRTSKGAWRASNIGTVDTTGFECTLRVKPEKLGMGPVIKDIFVDYTGLDSYRKHDYFSKYALDYLKQHIASGLTYELLGFKNTWVMNFKKRVGDSGYITVDTKVARPVFLKGGISFEVFFDISNMFDVAYSEQSDVPMPGRWITSGAKFEF